MAGDKIYKFLGEVDRIECNCNNNNCYLFLNVNKEKVVECKGNKYYILVQKSNNECKPEPIEIIKEDNKYLLKILCKNELNMSLLSNKIEVKFSIDPKKSAEYKLESYTIFKDYL